MPYFNSLNNDLNIHTACLIVWTFSEKEIETRPHETSHIGPS